MRKLTRISAIAAPLSAVAIALSAGAASAAPAPAYSGTQAGITTGYGPAGCGSVQSEVLTLPSSPGPNGQTSYAVQLTGSQGSVVLSLGPLSGGAYQAQVVNEINDYPLLTVGFDDASNPAVTTFRAGDNVLLELSYDSSGNVVWSAVNLTDDTQAPFTGTFLDAGQVFTSASAGAIFAQDVYGIVPSFTQPPASTVLASFRHTVITDAGGAVIPAPYTRVQLRAGGVKLGKLLATSGDGRAFTITLEKS